MKSSSLPSISSQPPCVPFSKILYSSKKLMINAGLQKILTWATIWKLIAQELAHCCPWWEPSLASWHLPLASLGKLPSRSIRPMERSESESYGHSPIRKVTPRAILQHSKMRLRSLCRVFTVLISNHYYKIGYLAGQSIDLPTYYVQLEVTSIYVETSSHSFICPSVHRISIKWSHTNIPML